MNNRYGEFYLKKGKVSFLKNGAALSHEQSPFYFFTEDFDLFSGSPYVMYDFTIRVSELNDGDTLEIQLPAGCKDTKIHSSTISYGRTDIDFTYSDSTINVALQTRSVPDLSKYISVTSSSVLLKFDRNLLDLVFPLMLVGISDDLEIAAQPVKPITEFKPPADEWRCPSFIVDDKFFPGCFITETN